MVDKVLSRNRDAKEDVKALEDNFDGSVGRIALMNKLAARTDLLNQKEEEPVPKPVAKPVQAIETRCFQVICSSRFHSFNKNSSCQICLIHRRKKQQAGRTTFATMSF